jgi:hypothetical protein
MSNEEAIKILALMDTSFMTAEQFRSYVQIMHIAKRFERAVKLKNATTWMELPNHVNNYHFYAVPKEQEE